MVNLVISLFNKGKQLMINRKLKTKILHIENVKKYYNLKNPKIICENYNRTFYK